MNQANPHALTTAQDSNERFEVMQPPPSNFNPYVDSPISTNTIATRGEVHEKGLWHCSVHIWIVKLDSITSSHPPSASPMVLLQKRSMKKDTFPGRWDISSAGHIEAGKGSLETAHLELAEELGVVLENPDTTTELMPPKESTTKNKITSETKWRGGLRYSFTIPAEQYPLGGCNAYEHVYFLIYDGPKSDSKDIEEFSLGHAEVSEVSWVSAREVLKSLQEGDDNYAPRSKDYVICMEKELKSILGLDQL